ENDRDRRGRRLGGECCIVTVREDHGDLPTDQFGCHHRQLFDFILGPAILDRYVLALDEAALLQTLAHGPRKVGVLAERPGREHPDHWHCRLLRARRQRPRGNATKSREELAPPHVAYPAPKIIDLANIADHRWSASQQRAAPDVRIGSTAAVSVMPALGLL